MAVTKGGFGRLAEEMLRLNELVSSTEDDFNIKPQNFVNKFE